MASTRTIRKMTHLVTGSIAIGLCLVSGLSLASEVVPKIIELPGSQPGGASLSSSRCENCHGGSYDPAVEPGFTWRGSMMSHAMRDPLFLATLAVAEQDFMPNLTVWNNLNPGTSPGTDPPGGVGDLCLRCHTPEGWIGGRSTPTDGSGLSLSSDFDGVSCDTCHRLVDPATAEGRRLMPASHEAYWINPAGELEAFYGSGQYILDPGGGKRGPYDDASARSHDGIPSLFQRSGDLCGTCHDVSNSAVGQFAANHGRLDAMPLPVNFCLITKTECVDDASCADCEASQEVCETTCDGSWDATLAPSCDRQDTCRTTVADAYPPYMYGIVERTYSEWRASAWDELETATFIDDPSVPADLKVVGGAPEVASRNEPYNSSTDPIFNPPRTFSCQSCHMRSVTGQGCNKDPEVRSDLPLHDLTGGSTWLPLAIVDMSGAGTLVGGELPPEQIPALDAGITRARGQLRQAVKLDPLSTPSGGLIARVTNLTGHKFLTGYPEGRRAWIGARWYDAENNLLYEAGAYDEATAELRTADTRVYEAKPGISRDWAETLIAVGYDPALSLAFDEEGATTTTLGELAAGILGEAISTFHFVLNNTILKDDRIPPYGFDPVEGAKRNALSVPPDLYPALADGTLQYWDEVPFGVPVGAVRAEMQVFYQSTSRDYIDFLRFANTTNSLGEDLYQAWLNTGMAPPEPLLASAGSPQPVGWTVPPCDGAPAPVGATLSILTGSLPGEAHLVWGVVSDATGYRVHRWGSADRTGEETSYLIARTDFKDKESPGPGEILYYEIGSTTACGETVGEFSGGSQETQLAVRTSETAVTEGDGRRRVTDWPRASRRPAFGSPPGVIT